MFFTFKGENYKLHGHVNVTKLNTQQWRHF